MERKHLETLLDFEISDSSSMGGSSIASYDTQDQEAKVRHEAAKIYALRKKQRQRLREEMQGIKQPLED